MTKFNKNTKGLSSIFFQAVLFSFPVLFFVIFLSPNDIAPGKLSAVLFLSFLMFSVFFSLGRKPVVVFFRERLRGNTLSAFLFPFAALAVVCFYSFFISEDVPFFSCLMLGLVLFFQCLVFVYFSGREKPVNWLDLVLFTVAVFPAVVISLRIPCRIPPGPFYFQTSVRMALTLNIVYVALILRGLDLVGFEMKFSLTHLLTSVLCWAGIAVLVSVAFYHTELIEYKGYEEISPAGFQKGARRFLKHLFYVGIFEELLFRGIFQNILARNLKGLGNTAFSRVFKFGVICCVFISVIAVFITDGEMKWFPPLVTVTLFGLAYCVESRFPARRGEYLSLAIICAFFGVAHVHTGSSVFVGVAGLAGWFYGYVYIRTKNVFYCGLTHALVNCSPMFLGMKIHF